MLSSIPLECPHFIPPRTYPLSITLGVLILVLFYSSFISSSTFQEHIFYFVRSPYNVKIIILHVVYLLICRMSEKKNNYSCCVVAMKGSNRQSMETCILSIKDDKQLFMLYTTMWQK